MPRTCIFCGSPPKSREDVWPCWMTSHFVAPGIMESERGRSLEIRTWPVDRPELVIRCVCGGCNNGWMSRLQDGAKPIIERLWTSEEYSLDLHDRRTLASWAVMTSMVLQTLDEPDNWSYSELDRTVFWKRQHIPSFMGIWIANCVGHASMYTQGRSMLTGPPQGSARQARGHAISMAFGTLGIQVLKVTLEGAVKLPKDITVSQGFGDWENIALQIWPLKGDPVNWPPPKGIRCEPELELFAGRFRSRDDSSDGTDLTIASSDEEEAD
jgi:hypothetical protein